MKAAAALEAERRRAHADAEAADAAFARAANGGSDPRSDDDTADGSHCFEILGIDVMVGGGGG